MSEQPREDQVRYRLKREPAFQALPEHKREIATRAAIALGGATPTRHSKPERPPKGSKKVLCMLCSLPQVIRRRKGRWMITPHKCPHGKHCQREPKRGRATPSRYTPACADCMSARLR